MGFRETKIGRTISGIRSVGQDRRTIVRKVTGSRGASTAGCCLPVTPCHIRHHVDRPRSRIERERFACHQPSAESGACTPIPATVRISSRSVGLVAVPADADAGVVFGKEDLGNFEYPAAKPFDTFDHRLSHGGIGAAFQASAAACNCSESRTTPRVAYLIFAETEMVERKCRDAFDQSLSVAGEMNSAA